MSACIASDDGLHVWRWSVSRMAGTPHYACDFCPTIALPTGDGVAEDYAHLGSSGTVARDDNRTAWRVMTALTAYVEVQVLAADRDDAIDAATEIADDLFERADGSVRHLGIGFSLPVDVVDVDAA